MRIEELFLGASTRKNINAGINSEKVLFGEVRFRLTQDGQVEITGPNVPYMYFYLDELIIVVDLLKKYGNTRGP